MKIAFIKRPKKYHFRICNHFITNRNKKMSRGDAEYLLQISPDQLKAQLSVAGNAVDNACTNLLED